MAAAADRPDEPLPPPLRRRLERCADEWLRERDAQGSRAQTGQLARGPLPWLVATASLVLASVAWWPQLSRFEGTVARAGGLEQWRAQRAREQMLASAGVGRWAWGGASAMGAGDVVWDARSQRGFLRLQGFVPNDPARTQYQLWIFDAARDDRYPVDGGTFDVPAGHDDVIVSVQPALPVSRPVAFAVTVEQAGGAVVSEREKVVAFVRAGM